MIKIKRFDMKYIFSISRMWTKRLPLLLFIFCAGFAAHAQSLEDELLSSVEKTGGIYYAGAYSPVKYTAAPAGYEPFYVSHYGRHGSRWLLAEREYADVLKIFEDADRAKALSAAGEEVYRKIMSICRDGAGRTGELSPRGFQQHAEIASRMFRSFPEVFRGIKKVDARSTTVPRCMLSMTAFCDKMKALNPEISFDFQANAQTSACLNFIGKSHNPSIHKAYIDWISDENAAWRDVQKRFADAHLHPQRLTDMLFADRTYAEKHVDGLKLMTGLFTLASSVQNTGLDVSLYGIFEREELYALFVYFNFTYYACYGTYPPNKSRPAYYASVLLEDMLTLADSAAENRAPAAHLRFGHDASLMCLTGLLELEGCVSQETDPLKAAERWQTFRIAPMAASLQWIFYRKKPSGDILVRILLNEREVGVPVETSMFPYYRWNDLKRFYREKLEILKETNFISKESNSTLLESTSTLLESNLTLRESTPMLLESNSTLRASTPTLLESNLTLGASTPMLLESN